MHTPIPIPNCQSFTEYFNIETIESAIGQAIDYDWDERQDYEFDEDDPDKEIIIDGYDQPSISVYPIQVLQEIVNFMWEYLQQMGDETEKSSDESDEIYIERCENLIKLTKPYWVIKPKA